MNKPVLFTLCLVGLAINVFGQNVTNNNTITINGNVYYFKPSTSPSSPLPDAKYSSGWIGDGEWWGEDAAKAWASIVDWVVLHCYEKQVVNFNRDSNNVYINRLVARKSSTSSQQGYISITYWTVSKRAKIEEGMPVRQLWNVSF